MTRSGRNEDEALAWIALTVVPDVGPVTARNLLARFGEPSRIFGANPTDLAAVDGMTKERVRQITEFKGWHEAEVLLRAAEQKGVRIVPIAGPDYPEALKSLDDAPPVLYMRGSCSPEDRFSIAVVGSRKYTDYGESVSHRLSTQLAASGFTIVSGLARGIDTVAHRAALGAGGRTLAVLGCGVDVCYPAENRGLMDRIAGAGAVISEFPPGAEPLREHFPRRNRLISGLSLGVVVVEAADRSGALLTAASALEQNREVFAVPGNITSPSSVGTNRLIRQGAKAVLDVDDIVGELAPMLKGFLKREARATTALNEGEEGICRTLSGEPRHIDGIAREARIPVTTALNLLLSLELKGVVRQAGGKRFYLSVGGRT